MNQENEWEQMSMFPESDQDGSYGKMSPVRLQAAHQAEKTSASSLKKFAASSIQPPMFLDLQTDGVLRGASWDEDGVSFGDYTIASFGEFPSVVVESHLLQTLEAKVPQKYYLSAATCMGILRRSKDRGKDLPGVLRMVLEKQSHSKNDLDAKVVEKDCLCNETESEHCQHSTSSASSNDITIAYKKKSHPHSLEEGQGWEEAQVNDSLNVFDSCEKWTTTLVVNSSKVYGISPYTSNSMKSDNPNSGIYEADSSRTLDVCGGNPDRNQGGMVVLSKSIDDMVARRLTPLECCRLQGFPDGWVEIGDWVDSKGKVHKDSDRPKFTAIGNSIALPFWEWLMKRIKEYDKDCNTMASLFDGIGGFPLVCKRNGIDPLWASEIEEFPIAVTKKHFGESGDIDKFINERRWT